MIRLPYTDLRVPIAELRVTSATLLRDGRILATVQDHDTVLGNLTVGPQAVDIDMGSDACRRLSLFSGLCRTTDGKRPSRETVLRELVMEYRYARAIAEAARSSWPQVVVRAFHTDGTITLHQMDAPGPIGPGPDLKVDPTLFTTDVDRVQAWMRDLWLPVTPLTSKDAYRPASPRLARLPHTGVRIPARFSMRVTHLIEKGEEGAWSAQLWVRAGGESVWLGTLSGEGDVVAFDEQGPNGNKLLLTYTLMSRGPDGEALEWQDLVSLLVSEHQTDREATRARRQGYYLVRLIRTGEEGPNTTLAGIMDATPGATYPDYERARARAAKFLEEPQVMRVQVWAGEAWVDATPPPERN